MGGVLSLAGVRASVEERFGDGLGATKGDMAGDGSPAAEATKGDESTPCVAGLAVRDVSRSLSSCTKRHLAP